MEDERFVSKDIPSSEIRKTKVPIWAVKNERTREFVRVYAHNRLEAIGIPGWDPEDVRWCWQINSTKQKMPEDTKVELKERKAVEKVEAGPPVPKVRVAVLLQQIWDEGRAGHKAALEIIADIEQLLKERHPGSDNTKQAKWYYHKLRRAAGVPNENLD